MILPFAAAETVTKFVRAGVVALALGLPLFAVTPAANTAGDSTEEASRAARTIAPNPAPTGVAASVISPTVISVTWVSGGGNRHWVTRSTNGGPEVTAGYGSWGAFVDNGLVPGVNYTYRVTSVVDYPEGSDYSPPSTPVTATTAAFAGLDIGNVGATGSMSRNGHVLSVTGSGGDIWGNTDEFHFEQVQWTGDVVLLARVQDVQRTDFWAKGGLMIRESLTGGSRYAMVFANPNGDGNFQTRSVTGGVTSIAGRDLTFVPSWLKLTRSGSTFRAFQSRDGAAWAEIGSAILDLPSTVYVGLAVTSHRRGTPSTASFDNLSISPTRNPLGPAVPENVTATSTAWNEVRVNWTDVSSDEAAFSVEKSEDNINFASAGGAGPNGTGATIPSLTPATTYYFRVRALTSSADHDMDSAGYSNVVSVTTQPPPSNAPAPPSGLTATVISAYQINLSWTDNSTTETRFVIERSFDGVTYHQHSAVDANVTRFSGTDLFPSTTYHFRVRARMADGYTSAPSNSVTATTQPEPASSSAPSAATATALSSSSIRVTWADNSSDETQFRVEYSTDGVSFGAGANAPANATSLDLTFLEPGRLYYFRVRALNGSVYSEPSNVASATTQAPPATPTGLVASAVSAARVDLQWNDSGTTATHYQIWRAEGGSGMALSHLQTIPAAQRTYSDSTVNPATTYRYQVRALQDLTVSGYSNTATATTPAGTPSGWDSRDIGGVAAAGSAGESGGTLTVRGSGEDVWGTNDEFHFRSQAWAGDGTFIARVTGMTNPHAWAKAGIMLRESAESGARHVFLCANPNNYGGLVWRPTANGPSQFAGAPYQISQMWLKLVRTGNSFQAFQSADGATWFAIGSSVDVALSGTVLAGIAVTSHVDGVLCTATFSNVSFTGGPPPSSDSPTPPSGLTASAKSATSVTLAWTDNAINETGFEIVRSTDDVNFTAIHFPSANATSHVDSTVSASTTYYYRIRASKSGTPSAYSNTATVTTPAAGLPATWAFGDIGAVGVAGSNSSNGNTITISASGSDIWDTTDAFRFVHRSLTGDGVVEARVMSVGYTHGWAKAGVIIRESLAANARNAFAFVTPVHQGIGAQVRDTTGGLTTYQRGPAHNAPYWVRLARAGNTFTASSSPDGITWTVYATSTIPMGATAYFGFALTSHDNTTLTTATLADPFVQ